VPVRSPFSLLSRGGSHIFLFRLNIDIRNDNINQQLEAGLVATFKHKLSLDENGQAVIVKNWPLLCRKVKRRPNEEIVEEKGRDVQSPRIKREKSIASVRLLRVTGYVYRFVRLFQKKISQQGPITAMGCSANP